MIDYIPKLNSTTFIIEYLGHKRNTTNIKSQDKYTSISLGGMKQINFKILKRKRVIMRN